MFPFQQQAEPPSIDLYDSDILKIEKVLEVLDGRTFHGQSHDRGKFDQEIRERFAEIGLVVETRWWHTDHEDTKLPEVFFVGRVDPKPFDHDQMRHEVVNDLLELGEGGTIKVTPDEVKQALATEAAHKRQHQQYGTRDDTEPHSH